MAINQEFLLKKMELMCNLMELDYVESKTIATSLKDFEVTLEEEIDLRNTIISTIVNITDKSKLDFAEIEEVINLIGLTQVESLLALIELNTKGELQSAILEDQESYTTKFLNMESIDFFIVTEKNLFLSIVSNVVIASNNPTLIKFVLNKMDKSNVINAIPDLSTGIGA